MNTPEWEKAFENVPKETKEAVEGFIKEIPFMPFFSMKGAIKAEWHVSYGATWKEARRQAKRDARSIIRNSEFEAHSDLAYASAKQKGWKSAELLTWKEANKATQAMNGAMQYAAWDMALYAVLLLVGKEKLAAKRLEVWEAGYGLLCDVDGKLFVYAVGV